MVYCRSQRDRQNAAAVGHIQLIRRGQAKEMKEIEYDCSSSPSNESFIGRDPIWGLLFLELSGGCIHSMASDHPQLNGKEPGKHPLRAMHGFAHEKNHDPQLGLNDFVGGSTAAATQLRGGLPPHVVRRVREHIDSSIDRRIKVKSLANLANLSVVLLRACVQAVGRGYATRLSDKAAAKAHHGAAVG
jgi:hypothetical protein